ncbi:MAG: HAD-IIA family hydrolase [Acidimicrobiales bacterium]
MDWAEGVAPSCARPSACEHDRMRGDLGTWILDLDGVIWLAEEPIPGSAQAVTRLRELGAGVLFATNNAAPTVSTLIERLGRAGIAAEREEIVTSAQAAASLLEPGSTCFVCGDAGLREAMFERGVRIVEEGPADTVVVGWTRNFDFDLLARATTLVRAGARFIGTNDDATFPTPERLLPGCGALLAAASVASQATPEVAGKPHPPTVALLRRLAPDAVRVVGDRPSTDGRLAQALGVPFAHVRSGVTSDGREPMVVEPDEEADDLLALVQHVLGR